MSHFDDWAVWQQDADFNLPETETQQILTKFGVESGVVRQVSRERRGEANWKRHYALLLVVPMKGNKPLMDRLGEIGYRVLRKHKIKGGYQMAVRLHRTVKIVDEGTQAYDG